MRRYWTGVSSLLSVCALAGVCASSTARALDTPPPQACQPIALIKNIAPGSTSSIPDDGIQPPAVRGKTVFFAAKDGTTGLELWSSRGKEGDTALVKDIFEGAGNADPRLLTGVGDTLFFIANDGVHGRELWKTDGTADGTVLVKDLRPGTGSSEATALTALGNTLFFIADDGVHGPELWKSDGTEAGTVLVKDFVPGALGSGLGSLVVLKNVLYFAADGGPHETELWKSDGTEAGTQRVAIVRVIESDPGEQTIRGLTPVGEQLYFFAGSSHGEQWDLWKSDGTGPGTVRVKSLLVGPADYTAGPVSMTLSGGQVYFRAGEGGSLWRSDGTAAGTIILQHSSDARWLTDLKGTLLFTARDDENGYELWRTDGTAAGTKLIEDLRPGSDSSSPFWLTVVDGKVLFSAETEEYGRELWSTDGTLDGTVMLHDAVPGTGSLAPSWLTPVGPRVFFIADDGTPGAEPWVLNDCTPPELSCPSEMVAEARDAWGAIVTYENATAVDNKPGQPVVEYSSANGTNFPLGSTQVLVTATDESGNSSRCAFSVKVRDTQAPALTCPEEQRAWRTNRRGTVVESLPPVRAADGVSTPVVTYSPPPGQFPLGTTPVVVTATDAAGNKSRCTFNVKVSRQYGDTGSGGCGCGAASPGGFAGGMLLTVLALWTGRRRKSGGPSHG